jgi:hypothetical protein
MVGLPESVVLYCARHRFSTDAMEGTGNLLAGMDAMGHEKMDTTRIYNQVLAFQRSTNSGRERGMGYRVLGVLGDCCRMPIQRQVPGRMPEGE